MKFGTMLPQSGPLATGHALVDVAQAAEDLGFSCVAVRDHISFDGAYTTTGMRDVMPADGDPRRMFESLTSLAFIAGSTQRIQLGTSVIIIPNRHPLLLAKQLSTIDYLSHGRLRVGFGIGPNRRESAADTTKLSTHRDNLVSEYDSFGAYGPRGPRADEYFSAMVHLWTEETSSLQGKYVHFRDITMYPKPMQQPYPPIVVGGRSGPARARAARWGAGWMPSQPTAEEMTLGVRDLQDRRAALEQQPLRGCDIIGINVHSIIAPSQDAAITQAAPTLGAVFPDRLQYLARTISGTIDDWRRRIAEYGVAGVNYIELKPVVPTIDALIEQLRVVHEEIMPEYAIE